MKIELFLFICLFFIRNVQVISFIFFKYYLSFKPVKRRSQLRIIIFHITWNCSICFKSFTFMILSNSLTLFAMKMLTQGKKFTRITKRLEIAMSWGMMFQHANILQGEQGAISAVDWTYSTEISFHLDKDLRGIE